LIDDFEEGQDFMPPRFKMAMNNDDNQSTADEETDYLVNNHACNLRSGLRKLFDLSHAVVVTGWNTNSWR
jgi:hypothetical protein